MINVQSVRMCVCVWGGGSCEHEWFSNRFDKRSNLTWPLNGDFSNRNLNSDNILTVARIIIKINT